MKNVTIHFMVGAQAGTAIVTFGCQPRLHQVFSAIWCKIAGEGSRDTNVLVSFDNGDYQEWGVISLKGIDAPHSYSIDGSNCSGDYEMRKEYPLPESEDTFTGEDQSHSDYFAWKVAKNV